MLRAERISRAIGAQVVLDAVSIALDGRDRVGIVGPNGVGKTTLLRILAGLDTPDGGEILRAPDTLTVGYLPQEPDARPDEGLLDYLARRTGIAAASDALDRATAAMGDDPATIADYTDALDRFLALGGDDFDTRAAETCDRVGLAGSTGGQPTHPDAERPGGSSEGSRHRSTDGSTPRPGTARATTAERFAQAASSLSGGEAARAALAAILLSRVDVLLLDEPTNNLDFAGLDLLEEFVDGFGGAVLVVSHDRAFLDRCIHRIVEIDEHSHKAREFAGGWSDYVDARELVRAQQYEAHDKYVSERDRLRSRQRRQRQWSDRGVRRAKTSSESDKLLRNKRAERSEQQASKVKATERAIDRLDVVDKPWEGWQLRLQLEPTARSGDVVARLDGAVVELGIDDTTEDTVGGEGHAVGVGDFRIGPVDLEINWQDRLAILGPNGSGKTTLLGALLGTIPLAAGRRWLGPGVRVGELDQARGLLDGEESVVRVVQRETGLDLSSTRSLLAKFDLGPDHVERLGAKLSPGERSRAILAVLMAQGVNCLVLDEPTNHLDLEAIEQLETALESYEGTLIVVSHDRRFLEAIDLTRSIDLTPR